MPEPARTAKLVAVPSCTAGIAAVAKTVMKIVVAVIAAILPAITVLVSFGEFLSAENNLCPLWLSQLHEAMFLNLHLLPLNR
jgi:hypothetical protein